MRLDRFVSNTSGLSRKDATLAIRAGRVSIDGQCCRQVNAAIQSVQRVMLDHDVLVEPQPLYLMLNKPAGVICANTDALHPTVLDLLSPKDIHPAIKGKLQIAGRLDIDTTGLVLITTDGDWNHRITSPNKTVGKIYRVTTQYPITTESISQLEIGVQLKNETKTTKPAKIQIQSQTCCRLEITEGKYHQVKRMFAATGNKVIGLHREAIANILLDTNLEPGQYRTLSATEIKLA